MRLGKNMGVNTSLNVNILYCELVLCLVAQFLIGGRWLFLPLVELLMLHFS